MDHRCDDGHIERFGSHLRAWNDVVVEFLSASCRATAIVPRFAGRVCWVGATIRVLFGLFGCIEVLVMLIDEHLQVNTHILCKISAACIVFHHTTACVMFCMPDDLIRCGFVQAQAERRLILPHFASNIIATPKLVSKTFAILVQHKSTNTAQSL